jgi:hypothetical protein
VVEGLVYFAAAVPGAPAVCSRRIVRPPSGPSTADGRRNLGRPAVGHYYVEAIRAYAHALQERPGHAAIGYLPELGATDRALSAVTLLCAIEAPHTAGWTPPVRLAGVARILAVDNAGSILATPLYIEYASR